MCSLLTDIYTFTLNKITFLHLFLLLQSNSGDLLHANMLHFWFRYNLCCIAEVCLKFFKWWNWKIVSLLTGRTTSLLNLWFEILLSKKTQSPDAVKGFHCQFLLSLKTGMKHEVTLNELTIWGFKCKPPGNNNLAFQCKKDSLWLKIK